MGIKHADIKATGQKGYATEWNKDHIITTDVNFNSKKITSLATPTQDSDGATKKYVDDSVGVTTFIGLTDTPNSYVGQDGKYTRVKADETGLEFAVPPAGVTKHTDLTDKEVVGVIDHADSSVTNDKILSVASTKITGTISDAQHGTRGSGLHTDSHTKLHAIDSATDHSGTITSTQIGADVVNDTHIDFGTGANQVSADDIPDGTINKMLTTGVQTIAGVKTFSSFPVTPSEAPTTDYQTANKKYVDDKVAGTRYWSVPGTAFHSTYPDVDDVITDETFTASVNNITPWTQVTLPHGAVVTACIVYGDATTVWLLKRWNHDNSASLQIASANVGTEVTGLSTTIDNNNYWYTLQASDVDSGEKIWGARITYTV